MVEILLSKAPKVIPEVCLVVDGSKAKGGGRFGFANIFLLPIDQKSNISGLGSILELKNCNLEGLARSEKGRWYSPSNDEMRGIANDLKGDTIDNLLAR